MDCKTARLFMHFSRPRADELDREEADGLDAHLAHCPDCAGLAQAERRLDHHFARAMRAIEPPEGLRTRLLTKLAADRADWYRRWVGHTVRAAAAAAALLLIVWGWTQYRKQTKPGLDVERVHSQYMGEHLSHKEDVEAYFARIKAPFPAPDYNYAYLSHFGLGELPGYAGVVVPRLEFVKGDRRAVVYVISDRRFEVKKLPVIDPEEHQGYPYKIAILPSLTDARFAFVILYTGDGHGWFTNGGTT